LLLGAASNHLAAVHQRLMENGEPPAPLEVPLETSYGQPRILKIQAPIVCERPHPGPHPDDIDISEQRAMERDVLTAANHERLRLAGDIHDGLGRNFLASH